MEIEDRSGMNIFTDEGVEIICPFCSKRVFVIPARFAVLHQQPVCKQYAENEPDVFIELINKQLNQSTYLS